MAKKKTEIAWTPESKVTIAQAKISEAVIMIDQTKTVLEEANEQLTEAVELANTNIGILKAQLAYEESMKQKALDELESNNKLIAHLDQ